MYKRQTNWCKTEVLGNIWRIDKRLPEAEFVVYEPLDCRVGDWFGKAPNLSVRRSPLPSEGRSRKFINGLNYWHNALYKERLDIFEGLNLPLIKAPTGRTLMTIHDIRGAQGKSGLLESMAYGVFLKRSLKSADHVITVSESMKKEILQVVPDLPISVIYNGLDVRTFDVVSETDQQAVRQSMIYHQSSS